MDYNRTDLKQKNQSDENIYREDSFKEIEKKKLQDFYSSVLGNNPEEIKTNSRVMRRKIYVFGLAVLIGAFLLYFLVLGKISFVTS